MEDSGTVKKKSAPEELIIIVYGRCVGRGIITPIPPLRGGGGSNQQVDSMDFPIKAVMSDTACWQIGLPLD